MAKKTTWNKDGSMTSEEDTEYFNKIDMSETQEKFIEQLCKKYDEKYAKMVKLFSLAFGIFLTAGLSVGGVQLITQGAIKRQQDINTAAIKYIMDNSVSQKAIDLLIVSFENQTKVVEQFFPDDIKGGVIEFNKKSSDLRANIIMFNSSLNNRGGNSEGGEK
jgi:hypothetical protein